MMFEKLSNFYALFRSGMTIGDAIKMKKRSAYAGLFAGFFSAVLLIAKGFGYDLPLSNEDLLHIGGALGVVISLYQTRSIVATTDKFSVPADQRQDAAFPPAPAVGTESVVLRDPIEPTIVRAVPDEPAPTAMQSEPKAPTGNVLDGLDSTYFG